MAGGAFDIGKNEQVGQSGPAPRIPFVESPTVPVPSPPRRLFPLRAPEEPGFGPELFKGLTGAFDSVRNIFAAQQLHQNQLDFATAAAKFGVDNSAALTQAMQTGGYTSADPNNMIALYKNSGEQLIQQYQNDPKLNPAIKSQLIDHMTNVYGQSLEHLSPVMAHRALTGQTAQAADLQQQALDAQTVATDAKGNLLPGPDGGAGDRYMATLKSLYGNQPQVLQEKTDEFNQKRELALMQKWATQDPPAAIAALTSPNFAKQYPNITAAQQQELRSRVLTQNDYATKAVESALTAQMGLQEQQIVAKIAAGGNASADLENLAAHYPQARDFYEAHTGRPYEPASTFPVDATLKSIETADPDTLMAIRQTVGNAEAFHTLATKDAARIEIAQSNRTKQLTQTDELYKAQVRVALDKEFFPIVSAMQKQMNKYSALPQLDREQFNRYVDMAFLANKNNPLAAQKMVEDQYRQYIKTAPVGGPSSAPGTVAGNWKAALK